GAPVASIFGLSTFHAHDSAAATAAMIEELYGWYWEPWLGLFRDGVLRVPGRHPIERADLAGSFDMIGFSYYSNAGVADGRQVHHPVGAPVSPLGYGIDGDGSGDVLQGGCDSDVMTSGGNITRELKPWWEWYPADSFWISNFPVAQGDTLNVLICVDANSTTSAQIYFYNLTSLMGTSFTATAPQGTSLVGDTAEWIVERLSIDSNTPHL
ncbi:hypothetical protein B4Q13_20145, partial [Lacticaseibacillus rhamnosus]